MNDSTLFPIIGILLALYVLVAVVEVAKKLYDWFHRNDWKRDDIECPRCGEIAFKWYGTITPEQGVPFDEYECNECKCYGTF